MIETVGSYAETCDDANFINGDGCTLCAIDVGFFCSRSGPTSPDVCSFLCGNSLIDSVGLHIETCDDGNTLSGDGCSTSCTIEDEYTCVRLSPTDADVCTPRCGNSALDSFGSYVE